MRVLDDAMYSILRRNDHSYVDVDLSGSIGGYSFLGYLERLSGSSLHDMTSYVDVCRTMLLDMYMRLVVHVPSNGFPTTCFTIYSGASFVGQ